MKRKPYKISPAKLKARRATLGLTQQQVADRAGLAFSTHYSRFEQGEGQPTLDIALRLADALEIGIRDLID